MPSITIPQQPTMSTEQAFEMLNSWHALQQKLAEIKTQEILLRKQLASHFFKSPVEGTQRIDIGFNKDLKLEFSFNRTVDEAALAENTPALRKAKIKLDDLVLYKPVLVVREYRNLTAEQQEKFDACLSIEEAAPRLSIVDKEIPAVAHLVMTAKANGVPYQNFLAQGWTDELMIAHGYAEKPTVEVPAPPAATKAKRGRGRPRKSAE